MLKIDIPLTKYLIMETWKLVGSIRRYPEDWKIGQFTPIFKKGDPEVPMNYRPVCMLSCIRKIIEVELADRILERCKHAEGNTACREAYLEL